MSSTSSNFVLGYHGCDRTVGEAIIAGSGHLNPSINRYDWLGSGVYFWERDDLRALEFAKELSMRRKLPSVKIPFVLGAVIDLGNCLDLMQRKNLKLVDQAYQVLKNSFEESGIPLPKNRRTSKSADLLLRDLDCAVINSIHTTLAAAGKPPLDTVRAAFWEGDELYPDAGFRAQNHVQICVRNPNCIKGYFKPLRKIAGFPLPGGA
jgi:hypothetical protein